MNPHVQRIREEAIAERLRRVQAQLAAERAPALAASGLPAAAFDRRLTIEQRRAALTAAGFGCRHCHPGKGWHSHPGGDGIHNHDVSNPGAVREQLTAAQQQAATRALARARRGEVVPVRDAAGAIVAFRDPVDPKVVEHVHSERKS